MDPTVPAPKAVLITDVIHGSIPLTMFEKQLISAQLFSRLHNVLQNSTVYYTYPSSRTTRFSHSLGAMHLAGEIYYRGVLNANLQVQNRFVGDLFAEVEAILKSEQVGNELDHCLTDDSTVHKILRDPFFTGDIDVVYQEHLPNLPGNPEHQRAYLIGYQAIRIAGLLHDVGHPPLSHVSEYALGDIRRRLGELECSSTRQHRFLEILDDVAPGNKEIHEGVGLGLARRLLGVTVRKLCEGDKNDPRSLFYLLAKELALRILNGDTDSSPIALALHAIIDGDFDADRLDYVTRDALASGISGEPFRYERLRNSLRLVYHTRPDSIASPRFLPSVRALSDLERFFRLRQDLYKYVVNHHRVVRTDGLMMEALKELAADYLTDTSADPEQPISWEVPRAIQGLWVALDLKTHATSREFFEHYIQWDDAWLITMLRDAYFRAVQKRRAASSEERSLIEMRLEEVISNKRYYFSLYKSIESFVAVDDAFLHALPPNTDLWVVVPDEERDSPGIHTRIETIAEVLDAHHRGFSPSQIRERHGFVTYLFRELWQAIWRATPDGGVGFAKEAAHALLERHRIDLALRDVLVISKILKRGVDDDFVVHDNGRVVGLNEVSRLARDLAVTTAYFPPFFTYLAREEPIDDATMCTLRREFGEELARCLVAEININISSAKPLQT